MYVVKDISTHVIALICLAGLLIWINLGVVSRIVKNPNYRIGWGAVSLGVWCGVALVLTFMWAAIEDFGKGEPEVPLLCFSIFAVTSVASGIGALLAFLVGRYESTSQHSSEE